MNLNAGINVAEAALRAPPGHLDTVQWANDAHSLAASAYAKIPEDRTSGWEKAYEAAEWPII